MNGFIYEIDATTANEFLLPRHYSGRKPTITKAFGWFDSNRYDPQNLKAVCTFGKPANPYLCDGVCGKEFSESVYELNRLCRVDGWKYPLSEFVGACLRKLRALNWIVVSYSDTAMNHHGYIYQACNFIYTGCTNPRTDMYVPAGRHSRHYNRTEQGEFRTYRFPKHRYVYFCTSDRKLKKRWAECLRYQTQPYPKGDNNKDYVLGDYMESVLVSTETGEYVNASTVEEKLQYSFF